MILSAVICTFNRVRNLRTLLETLAVQTLDPEKYEILVIDNACTDETPSVVSAFSGKLPRLHYFYEEKTGLSHARNRGWKEARGAYVGYVDDDCKVPPEWLQIACEVAEQMSPHAFGGPYYAFYSSPKPAWFKDEYGSHVQGDVARPLLPDEYLDGGNMFLRREVLEQIGGFRPDLGMSGKRLAFGEETLLLRELRSLHPQAVLYYDPRLFVHHLVPPDKWKILKLFRRSFINGRYSFRVFDERHESDSIVATKEIYYTLAELTGVLASALFRRNKEKYPFYQNSLYEQGLRRFSELGYKVESLLQSMKK